LLGLRGPFQETRLRLSRPLREEGIKLGNRSRVVLLRHQRGSVLQALVVRSTCRIGELGRNCDWRRGFVSRGWRHLAGRLRVDRRRADQRSDEHNACGAASRTLEFRVGSENEHGETEQDQGSILTAANRAVDFGNFGGQR
jgi:hypothetical protein